MADVRPTKSHVAVAVRSPTSGPRAVPLALAREGPDGGARKSARADRARADPAPVVRGADAETGGADAVTERARRVEPVGAASRVRRPRRARHADVGIDRRSHERDHPEL